MEYLLAIYAEEEGIATMSEEDMGEFMQAWFKYDEDVRKAVKVISGNALQPTSAATTVRGKGGDTVTSDGPFAETKEQLGGYYLIEASDLDQALEWAGKMPNIPAGGAVEVRPIQDFDHHH